jgi:cytochrome c oxidase subunit 4
MNNGENQKTRNGGTSAYVVVWAVLLALTGVTIAVASAGPSLGAFSTLTAVAIASLKAGLVCWYFMHLKYEKRFFKLLLLVPIVTLAVMIGLTFVDIGYR